MMTSHAISAVLAEKGSDVLTVSPQTRVFDALVIMAQADVGALVVVEDGRPVGMFSERDYARKVILHGKASKQIEIREVMTQPIRTISPRDTVEDCMALMTVRRIRHLPVLENDRLIGIVSIGDMVKWTLSAQEDTIHELENYISGKYPA